MSETTSRQAAEPGANRAFDWLIVGVAISIAAIIAAAKYTGCYSAPGRSAPASSLQVDIASPPGALDPRFATGVVAAHIDELIYAPLVGIGADGNFVPDLAQSFERPTPTTIVFHLRPGLRFSDGRPLRARDVKYTYDSILDPASHSPKHAGLKALASITAPDDTTVIMKTARPYGPALRMATVGVVPYGTPPPGKGAMQQPAASGLFQIVRFARDESVVLARNPYRSHALGKIAEIVFKVVPDPTVRALELADGVCDLAENNIGPGLLGYLEVRPNLVIKTTPGSRYFYLAFNFHNPRLRDLRVRRAIAYAIDRRLIMGSLYGGAGRAATGMLSPENWAYDAGVTRYHFDRHKASRLLDEAGYPIQADGTRKLNFVYLTTPQGQKLANALKRMLNRVRIGLKIDVSKPATFYSDFEQGKFDLFSSQWEGINAPYEYYARFDSRMVPPAGDNRGNYSNPAMDRLFEAGETTVEPGARRKIYAQVQALAARDLPTVPLWWIDNIVVLNRRVKGFVPCPNGSLRSLGNVSLVQPAGERTH
jgi:peptide/nickel transport system substrate-binding protein